MRFTISLVTLFFLSLPGYAMDFDDDEGRSWKIIGDFSQCHRNMPAKALLLRSCFLEPADKDKTEVEKVIISGYKDGEIIIELDLPEKSRHIESIAQDLMKLKLGSQVNCFESYFKTDNPKSFSEFLGLFSSRGIICNSLVHKILKIVAMEPSELSLKSFRHEQKLNQDQLDLINATNRIGPNTKEMSDRIGPNNTRAIFQHHIRYTDELDKFPILATDGADTCVILAAYNRHDKRAALAHIDVETPVSCLAQVFSRIRTNNDTPLEVHLAGGNSVPGSIDLICSLIRFVNNSKNVVIKSSNLNTSASNALALDSTTGDICDSFDFNQIYFDQDLKVVFLVIQLSGIRQSPLIEQRLIK